MPLCMYTPLVSACLAGHVDNWVLVIIDIIDLLSYQNLMGFTQPIAQVGQRVANVMIPLYELAI